MAIATTTRKPPLRKTSSAVRAKTTGRFSALKEARATENAFASGEIKRIVGQFKAWLAAKRTARASRMAFQVVNVNGKLRLESADRRAKPIARGAHEAPVKAGWDPHEAGRRAVEELKNAEGGSWTGAELEVRFGLTAAALHRRRKEHRIVFWRDARHEFHYPAWQFTESGAVRPGVQEILQAFRSSDEWRVMRYFLAPRRQLEDRTPLALLRAGEVARVIAHAQVHGQENTW